MSVAEASKTKINNEGPRALRVRDVRSFQRYAAAVIMLVPATCVAIGRLFQTDDSDTRQTLDLIAANPDRQFTFALFGFIGLVTVVPAFLAAASLSRRRRPMLTTVALAVNLTAYLGAFAMGAIDNLYLIGASLPPEQRDVAAIVIDKMWSTGIPGVSTNLFVLGHIIGAILMGLALRGSIATVGWLAMLLTTPMHVVAFAVLQMPALDMAAWLLMTLAFACCAVKIVKMSNDEWDLPPLGQPRKDHLGQVLDGPKGPPSAGASRSWRPDGSRTTLPPTASIRGKLWADRISESIRGRTLPTVSVRDQRWWKTFTCIELPSCQPFGTLQHAGASAGMLIGAVPAGTSIAAFPAFRPKTRRVLVRTLPPI